MQPFSVKNPAVMNVRQILRSHEAKNLENLKNFQYLTI